MNEGSINLTVGKAKPNLQLIPVDGNGIKCTTFAYWKVHKTNTGSLLLIYG